MLECRLNLPSAGYCFAIAATGRAGDSIARVVLFVSVSTIPLRQRCFNCGHHFDLTNTCRCQQGQWLLYQAGSLNRLGVLACRVKECEVQTRPPSRAIAWRVGIVFTADLDADRLLPNLQNLADLKNDWHRPFAVVGGSVPIRRAFRID